jgi:ammonium transporter Rh
MTRTIRSVLLTAALLLALPGVSLASGAPGADPASLADVQKYERAIHVMAMLLVGFGFLMVFVKRYGRSALTATYLLVSVALPLYFLKDGLSPAGDPGTPMDRLLLAEFAAASLLICAGAVLGRLKMHQYLVLAVLFVPCYAFNEWVVLSGGLGLIAGKAVTDTGGSIVIHAFGAIFGLGVAAVMTTPREYDAPVESDESSDKFSLLGSMVLWLFWPSFCAALVAPPDVPKTAVNVIFALCGSTLATYFATVRLRGRISAADIANATLAGGVAIGSACSQTVPGIAFAIGGLAGVISTVGFAVIQPWLASGTGKIDTCGVLCLHGLPGLFGGVAVLFAGSAVDVGAQLAGIAATVLIAGISGIATGKAIACFGRRSEPYLDSEEFAAD